MSKSLKVFLACFIGAGIGALTALQINGYFWWLGLLVGGLTGYLSYEFKKVLGAIPRAWRAVSSWRPNWRSARAGFLITGVMVSWFTAFYGLLGLLDSIKTSISVIIFMGFVTLLISLVVGINFLFIKEDEEEIDWKPFWRYNSVYVCFYHLPIWTVKGIIYIVPRTPKFIWKVIIVLAQFIKTLFIMIHSEIRLLCGVDAAIGAVIGYLTGNVIVGAFAGGLFGVLNYEIVSKRVLKLAKNNS